MLGSATSKEAFQSVTVSQTRMVVGQLGFFCRHKKSGCDGSKNKGNADETAVCGDVTLWRGLLEEREWPQPQSRLISIIRERSELDGSAGPRGSHHL
jgi:hypothetical protein